MLFIWLIISGCNLKRMTVLGSDICINSDFHKWVEILALSENFGNSTLSLGRFSLLKFSFLTEQTTEVFVFIEKNGFDRCDFSAIFTVLKSDVDEFISSKQISLIQ